MFDLITVLLLILALSLGAMLLLAAYVLIRHSIEVEVAEKIARGHMDHLREPIEDLQSAYRYADDLKCYAVAVNVYQNAVQEMTKARKLVLPWPVKEGPEAREEDVEWIWEAGNALSRIIEQIQEEKKND